MLEILVGLKTTYDRHGNVNNRRGDVIVAKLSPAVWGSEEKRLFLITYLDDPELEQQIRDRQHKAWDFTIVQTFPYKKVEDVFVKRVPIRGVMRNITEHFVLNRSVRRVDIDKDFKQKTRDLDDESKFLEVQKPDKSANVKKADLIYDDEVRLVNNELRNRWLRRSKR